MTNPAINPERGPTNNIPAASWQDNEYPVNPFDGFSGTDGELQAVVSDYANVLGPGNPYDGYYTADKGIVKGLIAYDIAAARQAGTLTIQATMEGDS